jgi:hypothetical protein
MTGCIGLETCKNVGDWIQSVAQAQQHYKRVTCPLQPPVITSKFSLICRAAKGPAFRVGMCWCVGTLLPSLGVMSTRDFSIFAVI